MHLRAKSSALVAALAAIAIAIAGCGGGGSGPLSKSDYASQLKGILKPLGSTLDKVGTQAQDAKTKSQLEPVLRSGESAVSKAVDQVNALDPPSDVADTQKKLVSALTSFQTAFKNVEAAVASGNNSLSQEPPGVQAKVQKFKADAAKVVGQLNQVKAEYEKEGVKFSQ